MKQTIFKRKKDGVFFYLAFHSIAKPAEADFRTKDGEERYFMDEVIRNHKEFEQVDGELDFFTAKIGVEIVRVNKYGEFMRNPRVQEGKFYYKDGKRNRIDMVGAWDEDANAYRVIYGGKKGGVAFDTDFWVKPEQETI